MIKSFAVDSEPISLIPDAILEEPNLNLFSANSMTLLVGPNGSGKTHMLLALADAIASGARSQVQIEWATDTDARATFGLYFTPIPYETSIPGESHRFMALHPAKTRGKILAEVETAMDLADAFGLNAHPTLSLGSYSSAFDLLKELLFHPYTSRRPAYHFQDDWIAPFAVREAELLTKERVLRSSLRERKVKFEDIYSNEEAREIREQKLALDREVRDYVEDRLQEYATLKIRALQYVPRLQIFSKNVKIALLRQLGFPVVEEPSKKQPKAIERFHAAVSKLRRISNILGETRLEQSRYKISLVQWSKLSSLNLNSLGELSINNASSGSAALLNQFARLKNAVEKIAKKQHVRNLVLLIDEGDAFLHLEWQQQYINYLDITIERLWRDRFDSIQVVLTTHSPVLMSDFPRDCIHKLRNSQDRAAACTAGDIGFDKKLLSFGAPLDAIVRSVGGAGTIGMFAARFMRKLLRDVEDGVPVSAYHLEMIDDPVIKRHFQRIIDQRRPGVNETGGLNRAD